MDVWQVNQGIAASFVVTLRDDQDAVYTAYAGTEALSGTVRPGRDLPATFTLSPTWIDHTQGTVAVPVAGSATVGVEPGTYLVQVKLADGSADLYEGLLEVEFSPGSATPRKSYILLWHMTKYAPWLRKLLSTTTDPTALEARADAAAWFEDLLHRHYRSGMGLSADYAFVPGLSFGGGYAAWFRPGIRSKVLQGWLDAGGLDVTEAVIECQAYYALARICEGQVSPSKDESPYAAFARKFDARAEDAASLITAELDTNGDGTNDIWVRLGVADTLEG